MPGSEEEEDPEPATPRQKSTLLMLGLWREGMSFTEAWRLINSSFTKKGRGNR
jgi:hypothetical protein